MVTRALGHGLGLRPVHYPALLGEFRGSVSWLEALTENYPVPGGPPLHHLERIRQHYPLVLHGVSLSIGGTDPLDERYLRDVQALADRVQPAWISDHLCWTGVDGRQSARPACRCRSPKPRSRHVVSRVQHVQERLGRRFALETVSSYASFSPAPT